MQSATTTTDTRIRSASVIYLSSINEHATPRSPEYNRGVVDCLKFRTKETSGIATPFTVGTCQYDAWSSGVDYGHFLFRQEQERVKSMSEAVVCMSCLNEIPLADVNFDTSGNYKCDKCLSAEITFSLKCHEANQCRNNQNQKSI